MEISFILPDFLIYSVVFLSSFYLILYFQKVLKIPKDFPPGPIGHPIIGGLPQLGTNVPHNLMLLGQKKYGPIFSFDLAGYRAVILNDDKAIREALNMPGLGGKVPAKVFEFMTNGQNNQNQGVMFSSGKLQLEQRRFALKNMRDFGFGRKTMESLLEREINDLVERFKKLEKQPILLKTHFNGAVVNSLWQILSGVRYEQDDPNVVDLYFNMTSDVQKVFIFFFFPILFRVANLFPAFIGDKLASFKSTFKISLGFMKDHVEDHKKHYQEGSTNDYIDRYLTEIKNTTDPKSEFYGTKGESNLITSLHDFFLAGSETTSTVLNWVFYALSLYPDVQEKIHNEIKSVVGLSRYPMLADRPSMPYTEAFLMEILRYVSVIPFHFHYAIEDCELRGYKLPKGTVIGLNIYGAHHNPEVWGDPENFRPERFISKVDGSLLKNHEAFMPFSVGKRFCLGEPLARDELYLFTSALVQRFRVYPDPSKPTPKLVGLMEQVNIPKPFPIMFSDRFDEKLD